MTWSYGNDPASSALDEVRLLIGDTDTDDQQITDEAIEYALGKSSDNSLRAAALCCRLISSHYARQVDSSVDSVNVAASKRIEQYNRLASILEEQAKKSGTSAYGVPYVGGIDVDDIEEIRSDTSRQPSMFFVGQFTNNGSPSYRQSEPD
jgi:hypothetical protein